MYLMYVRLNIYILNIYINNIYIKYIFWNESIVSIQHQTESQQRQFEIFIIFIIESYALVYSIKRNIYSRN